MTPDVYRYDAFISYCHHPTDQFWAKWLHRRLETYRTPRRLRQRGIPSRLQRVFRDADELPASTDLSERIDEALRSSRFLVVICSTRTPASRWVGEEIERFIRMGRGGNILTLLIEGKPTDAFPPALLTPLGEEPSRDIRLEPLAADVRPVAGESSRRRRKDAALKLLAAILRVEFDELRQRDHERALRRLALLMAGISAAAIVLVALSIVAWAQRQEAIRRLGDSLLAQADGQRLLYRSASDRLYADAYDAYITSGTDTGLVDLAFSERTLSSPPPLALFTGHTGGVTRVVFTPDGRALVSGGRDGTLRHWDLATQTEISSLRVSGTPIVDLALFPEGDRALCATADGSLAIVDLRSQKIIKQLATGRANVKRVAVSPDGRTAAWGDEVGVLEFADLVDSDLKKAKGHADAVTGLVFHPDGRFLISASRDHTARLWDSADGTQLRVFDYGTLPYGDVAVVGDGRGVVVGRSGLDLGAHVWDLATDHSLPSDSLSTHGAANPASEFLRIVEVGAVAVSPESHYSFDDGEFTGDVAIGGEGGHVVVWDLSFQKDPRAVLIAHDGRLTSLTFSPDGRYLASGGTDGNVMVWSRTALSRVATTVSRQSGFMRSTAISPDGTMVAAGGDDGIVQIWDVPSRRLLSSLDIGAGITKVAFSPDATAVVMKHVNKPTLSAWRLTENAATILEGHTGNVTDFTFVPSSGSLVSVGLDRTLRVWGFPFDSKHRAIQLDEPALSIASMRRRATVTFATESGNVVLYDVNRERQLWSASNVDSDAYRLAVLGDDSLVASGSREGNIRVWDARDGDERFTLRGHEDSVTDIETYRGRWLLSTGWDHTMRVWDLETGTLVRTVQRGDMFGYSMDVAADGRFIASAGDGAVSLWSLQAEPRWLRYRETLRTASEALSRSKDDANALQTLAEWYARRGDEQLAIHLYERAIEAGGRIEHAELARLNWRSGRTEQTKRHYARALEANQVSQLFHDLRIRAIDAEVAAGDESSVPANFWLALWNLARRSRSVNGAEPGVSVDTTAAEWSEKYPEHELAKRLQMMRQVVEMELDPLQGIGPLPGILLPPVLTEGSAQAQLFASGPTDGGGRLFQMTHLSVGAGTSVRIQLSSEDFSPHLVVGLIGGETFEASERNGSAAIELTPQRATDLLIMCTTLEPGKRGSFTLRVW